MIKSVLAVVAAAVCAGAIAEFIAEPAPAVAAGPAPAAQSQGTSISDSNKPWIVAAAHLPDILGAVCTRGWPYYEPACLHDGRRSDGKVRVVRVIITDRSVTDRTLQIQR